MLIIVISCAWIIGILIGTIFHPGFAIVFAGLAPLPLLFFFRRYRKIIIMVSLCLFSLLGGIIRFQSTVPAFDENHLNYYNDRGIVEIRGTVNAYPETRDKTTHLRLSAHEIKNGSGWKAVSGNVLIFAPRYVSTDYGDMLQVAGELETPLQLCNFDYHRYLANQGIYSTMLNPIIDTLQKNDGISALAWIYRFRERLSAVLATVLPEPQAALAQGIILGIRSNIPQSLKDNLSISGTAHLLAISGVNLSILAGIMLAIGIWLFGRKRSLYAWLAMGTIWLYALLTGMQAPVIRGAIMASMFLAAAILGRQRSATTALTFAAAVMTGITPLILWDASFQMSFLAMAGLIYITPAIMSAGRKLIAKSVGEEGALVAPVRAISDSFSVTLGAIIAVWPVIAYYFGIFSFAGPLATLLAAPALPAIIVIGVITALAGILAPLAAQVLGWLVWLFVSYLLLIVNGFAALPTSHTEVAFPDVKLLWAYYMILALAIWASSRKTHIKRAVAYLCRPFKAGINRFAGAMAVLLWKGIIPALGVIAILLSIAAATMPDDNLRVSFLDVGQGDAILIQTPAHQDILVDGGPSPQAVSLELSRKMPFWDRTIDLVILTHPHTDHLTGLVEVLRRYQVKQVLAPDISDNSPVFAEWHTLITEKNIPVTTARAGQKIVLCKQTEIDVLNPSPDRKQAIEPVIDADTVVLRLKTGKVSFLLTADISQEMEAELISQRGLLDSAVLKVAHHGSNYSTGSGFLSVVKPQAAVISVGQDNHFNHPGVEMMKRLESKLDKDKIYRTDRDGTVEFITDGERLWVKKSK